MLETTTSLMWVLLPCLTALTLSEVQPSASSSMSYVVQAVERMSPLSRPLFYNHPLNQLLLSLKARLNCHITFEPSYLHVKYVNGTG